MTAGMRNKEMTILLRLILFFLAAILRVTFQEKIDCGGPSYEVLTLNLQKCSSDNCRGNCKTVQVDGWTFEVCCVDLNSLTCYDYGNTSALRSACFNATTGNDSSCSAFEKTAECASNFYTEDIGVCMEQYTELYKMGVLLTNNHFDPNYCPCEAGYTKLDGVCPPCTDRPANCGTYIEEKDICCINTTALRNVTPCTSKEHYDPKFLGTCISSECRGRCVNFTNHIITDFQVCCLSEETFRQPTHPNKPSKEGSISAGAVVGIVIAILVIGGGVAVAIVVYLRMKRKCMVKNTKQKTAYEEDIQMENRVFSNITGEVTNEPQERKSEDTVQ